MLIDKRNRAELKQYFVKNAIPTESNFAELIDAMLSQRDDGIAKLPNDPLSIEAAGDDTSQKKAIHFYNSFRDADPTWVLSLNPRQNPADAATAKPGLGITDGAGNTRLFVEKGTGRIGVGTNEPKKKLHVQGTSSGPLINDANDRPAIAVTGGYPELALFSNVANNNHGPTVRLGSYTDATGTTFKHWVIGTAGRNAAFLDIGFSDKSDPNPHCGIRGYNGRTVLTLKEGGNVGIGTLDPATDLTIRRDASAALGPVLTLVNGLGTAGAGAAIDFNGYDVGANNPTVRLRSLDDGNYSSHLAVSTKDPGAANNPLKERMRVNSNGNVSFTGCIVPSAGNTASNGIRFPTDPGGGSGDEAFIRYYPVAGESCKLMIGINNDSDDTIGFLQAGAERMVVGYGYVDVVADANPVRFTAGWTGFPDTATNRAEISNDTGTYKTLMLVGNKSNSLPGNPRRVSVWDRLEVNGTFAVTASISGGETSSGWTLGAGAWGPDNWLRLTTAPRGDKYHDLAVNSFWSAGAKRFDLAEVTAVRVEDGLEQGDVVVIDREDGRRVRRSGRAHDPAVYGIVSSYDQAAMVIGGFGGPEEMRGAADKLPIALAGRVKVKVTSENGPIRVGDLLTSSPTPGHAMRCTEPEKHPGAVVGKALEPFDGRTGAITALVALQ